jgi:hypothetical protein
MLEAAFSFPVLSAERHVGVSCAVNAVSNELCFITAQGGGGEGSDNVRASTGKSECWDTKYQFVRD